VAIFVGPDSVGDRWQHSSAVTIKCRESRIFNCVAIANSSINKNSSGDEIADVNFLTTISHTRRPTSKYRKRDKPTSFNKLDDR